MDHAYLINAREALARRDSAAGLSWARKYLELHPGDIAAAIMAARAVDSAAPAEAVAILRGALAHTREPAAQATLIMELLPFAERTERLKRGLPPDHVLDMREFPFHFSGADIAALRTTWNAVKPDDPVRLSLGPAIEFVLGDFAAADDLLLQAAARATNRKALGGHATVRYSDDFYRHLEGVKFEGLPSVRILKQARFSSPHVLYVGCDSTYFQTFATPLLRSLATAAPRADAHVHLMLVAGQPEPEIPALNLNLHVTCEVIQKGLDSPLYYHAMRLVRLYQFLDDRTLWMIDADALVNADPAHLYGRLHGDVGIRVRAGRTQPWNCFSAALVAATPASKAYFRLVAAYLVHFIAQAQFTWGMDQMALYGAYRYLPQKPALTLWGPQDFDVNTCGADATFWFTAGAFKKEYAAGTAAPPPDRQKYWDLYRRNA